MVGELEAARGQRAGRKARLALMATSWLAAMVLGIGLGAWWFHDVRPRQLLVRQSGQPGLPHLSSQALLGLLASAGIQTAPGLVPLVAARDSQCIAVRLPGSGMLRHFVAFPRRDLLDIADLSRPADAAAAADCLKLLAQIIRDEGYRDYRIYTNGPDQQDVRYLHFHLVALPHVTDDSISARFRPGYPLPRQARASEARPSR